jgi:Glyoxalase-like domain
MLLTCNGAIRIRQQVAPRKSFEESRMRIDHLVWYSPDLADGERYFAERMDCAPAYGGVHPGDGTRNSLLSLGDETYVEILARDPAQGASVSLDPQLASLTDQGLYHWAVGGVDLDEIIERARRSSFEVSDATGGGRRLPNGNWLGWKCVGLRNHGFGALVPFFIDWTDCAHPASSAPRGGAFRKVELFSPQAAKLSGLFQNLGLELSVAEREQPGIVATLEARGGPQVLNSFEPLPRGFVI